MDDYFKHPLNQAHFLQRRAERQELKGQFEEAIQSRNDALYNLKVAAETASCPIIKETVTLEIKLEKQKIELLKTKSNRIEKLIKTLENHSLKMAQAKSHPITLEIPSLNVAIKSQDVFCRLFDKSFKILQNTEQMETILNDLDNKVNFNKAKSNDLLLRKGSCALKDKYPWSIEELASAVSALKSHNVDNICLIKSFDKEINIVKAENAKLKSRIRELELKNDLGVRKRSGELLNDSGTSPFIVYPVEDMKSTDISIPEFPPLDCPPLDFLTQTDPVGNTVSPIRLSTT